MRTSKVNDLVLFILISQLLLLAPLNISASDEGSKLYLGHCAKCHGREGEGFLKLYPPIRNTRYLKEDVSKLPCIIRYGLKGEIVVDGVTFNQMMPAIQQLKTDDIGHIIRFLQTSWNHPVTPTDVVKWLNDCSQ